MKIWSTKAGGQVTKVVNFTGFTVLLQSELSKTKIHNVEMTMIALKSITEIRTINIM